mgnify:FL=1
MSVNINVSLNEMDNVISRLDTHANNIREKSLLLSNKVNELNGRDWNEETGRNITNTLYDATLNISNLVASINDMKTTLQTIRNNYALQYEEYRNQQ